MKVEIDFDTRILWKLRGLNRDEMAFSSIRLVTAWFTGNFWDEIAYKIDDEEGHAFVIAETDKDCMKLINELGAEERLCPSWDAAIERGEIRTAHLSDSSN